MAESKKHIITKVLSSSNEHVFNIIIPGKISVGHINPEKEDLNSVGQLTPEQEDFLRDTVLHSLVEPNLTVYLELTLGKEICHFPIHPLTLIDVECQAVYKDGIDGQSELVGTNLRLPRIHTCANKVLFNVQKGNPPLLKNLQLSYIADLKDWIDTCILRSRIAPGVSGLAMANDKIPDDSVVIPKDFSNHLINDLIYNLSDLIKHSEDPELIEEYEAKKAALIEKRNTFGSSIVSGIENIVVKREPATVYGAVKRKKLLVGNWTGNAIYTNSKVINKAGGDNDGDLLYLFNPEDPYGIQLTDYCINNKTPYFFKKIEDFSLATTTVRKKKYKREVDLLNTSWVKENEMVILNEYEEKNTIGRAWFALQHYNFLMARFPGDEEPLDSWNRRLNIIKEYAEQNPSEDVSEVYNNFIQATLEVDNDFSKFENKHWRLWYHLSYVTISHCFFPIYEIIFDMRKGDSKPKFNPSSAIQELMGYAPMASWEGMKQEGIWIEPLLEVYNSIPRHPDTGNINIGNMLAEKFPAFYNLVTQRNKLGAGYMYSSIYSLIPYMKDDFSSWLITQLTGRE